MCTVYLDCTDTDPKVVTKSLLCSTSTVALGRSDLAKTHI